MDNNINDNDKLHIWKALEAEPVELNKYTKFIRYLYDQGLGVEPQEFYVQKYKECVTIIPIDNDGMVTLERQFRPGFNSVITEIPAGQINDGEHPLDAAIREFKEETGSVPGTMIALGKGGFNPMTTDGIAHYYLALGCRQVDEQHLDDTEEVQFFKVPFEEFVQMSQLPIVPQAVMQSSSLIGLNYLGGCRPGKMEYTPGEISVYDVADRKGPGNPGKIDEFAESIDKLGYREYFNTATQSVNKDEKTGIIFNFGDPDFDPELKKFDSLYVLATKQNIDVDYDMQNRKISLKSDNYRIKAFLDGHVSAYEVADNGIFQIDPAEINDNEIKKFLNIRDEIYQGKENNIINNDER